MTLSAIQSMPAIDSITKRLPFNPSYMPELTSALDHRMTFSDRMKNVATAITYILVFTLINNAASETRSKFDIADLSPYYEDAELFLIHSDFALDFARPLLPNAIPVGGLTTKPAKPLPVVSAYIDFITGIPIANRLLEKSIRPSSLAADFFSPHFVV